MWETRVRSLRWEDPLEKEKVTTPVLWTREFHGTVHGVAKSDFHTFTFHNGIERIACQCSFMEEKYFYGFVMSLLII